MRKLQPPGALAGRWESPECDLSHSGGGGGCFLWIRTRTRPTLSSGPAQGRPCPPFHTIPERNRPHGPSVLAPLTFPECAAPISHSQAEVWASQGRSSGGRPAGSASPGKGVKGVRPLVQHLRALAPERTGTRPFPRRRGPGPRESQAAYRLLPSLPVLAPGLPGCLPPHAPFPPGMTPLLAPLFQQINPFCVSRRVRKRSSYRD